MSIKNKTRLNLNHISPKNKRPSNKQYIIESDEQTDKEYIDLWYSN